MPPKVLTHVRRSEPFSRSSLDHVGDPRQKVEVLRPFVVGTESVLQPVASILPGVEPLVLNYPSRPPSLCDAPAVMLAHLHVRDPDKTGPGTRLLLFLRALQHGKPVSAMLEVVHP